MSIQLMTYRSLSGAKTVLMDNGGRKYLKVLFMEGSGLVTRKLPLSEERFFSPVIQNGKSKSINTVMKRFRSYGKKVGMTKAAKSFLSKATKAV